MEARVVTRKPQDYGKRKAGPGRPKGSTKPAGSGKKAGNPNLMTPEFRQWLHDRARPFELLADICTGTAIYDGDTKRKPTVAERMRAAETLARKLLPDLAATAITGNAGGPVLIGASAPASRIEVARQVAFLLSSALHEMPEDPLPATAGEGAADPTAWPQHIDMKPAPPPPEPKQIGELVVGFAESLPGDRERWAIRDGAGRLVGSAIGREVAEQKARNMNGETE
jgi:hypothetical protein